MTSVKLYYLSGDIARLDECPTVGSIMAQVAMKHGRFASDVAVVCPDSGKDLTKPHSQAPPPAVSVVLKQAEDPPSIEDLDLTILLHAGYEDIATCNRAIEIIRRSHAPEVGLCVYWSIFDRILENYDPSWTLEMLRTLVRTGIHVDTVLHGFCQNNNKEAVEKLLAAGISPDGQDMEGNAALSFACSEGHADIVEILLSNGANVNIKERKGITPLSSASSGGHENIVKLLLAHGAQENRHGWAIHFASRGGHHNIVAPHTLLTSRVAAPQWGSHQKRCTALTWDAMTKPAI
eukprot:GEMP01027497.1.p1 GENE.GEMP01027497.1~~GEMP01027497.1.p1  ORF type:complete len:292 (+),score=50.98 GEMP01027497.1:147-1022(+)